MSFDPNDIKIALYNVQKQFANQALAQFEHLCKLYFPNALVPVATWQELEQLKPDAAVLVALHLDEESFEDWFDRIHQKCVSSSLIQTPALIIADIDSGLAHELAVKYLAQNWYFDFLNPDTRFDGFTVRLMNLLRIHDHIKELGFYEKTLATMQQKLDSLEKQISSDQK